MEAAEAGAPRREQHVTEIIGFMDELPPRLRELLSESFTFESVWAIPPRIFSALAPHRSFICAASRIPDLLHEAFPELNGQGLTYLPAHIFMKRVATGLPPGLSDFPDKKSWNRAIRDFQRLTPLPPPRPIVGDSQTFGGMRDECVLGALSGDWIAVVDDENIAFVGARSAADIARLEAAFGSRRAEAVGVLTHWKPTKDTKPSWLRDWLPAALEHVLGPDMTAELLASEGRWLAELANEFVTREIAINRMQRLQVWRGTEGLWRARLKGWTEVHCGRGKIHPDQRIDISWTAFSTDEAGGGVAMLRAARNGDLDSARIFAHGLRMDWAKSWRDPCDDRRQDKPSDKRR